MRKRHIYAIASGILLIIEILIGLGAVAMILPLFGSKDEIFDLEASIAAFDPKAEILALIEFQKLADGDVFKKSSKTIRTRQRASAIVRRFFEYKRYSS